MLTTPPDGTGGQTSPQSHNCASQGSRTDQTRSRHAPCGWNDLLASRGPPHTQKLDPAAAGAADHPHTTRAHRARGTTERARPRVLQASSRGDLHPQPTPQAHPGRGSSRDPRHQRLQRRIHRLPGRGVGEINAAIAKGKGSEGTRGASSQRRTAPPTAAPRAGELASAPVRRMPQAMRPALTVIPTESAPPPTSRAADHPTRPVRTAPGERPSARTHARSRRAHTVICTPSPPHKPTLAAGPAETPVTSAVNRVPARGRGGCRGGGEAGWWRGGHLHLHGEPPPRIEGEAGALARQLARGMVPGDAEAFVIGPALGWRRRQRRGGHRSRCDRRRRGGEGRSDGAAGSPPGISHIVAGGAQDEVGPPDAAGGVAGVTHHLPLTSVEHPPHQPNGQRITILVGRPDTQRGAAAGLHIDVAIDVHSKVMPRCVGAPLWGPCGKMVDTAAVLRAERRSTSAALDLTLAESIAGGDCSDRPRALADRRVAPTTTHVVACGLEASL